MPNIWDERFSGDGFVYGTSPSRWVEAQAGLLRPASRILSLGEGEGRNAVWLAERGHRLTAVDGSAAGLGKALRLAAERRVALEAVVADLADYRPAPGAYDAVLLVFLHLPPALRREVHARAEAALTPGGLLILEAFTPRQLAFRSGGPKQAEWLYDADTLRQDLPRLAWSSLSEVEVDLDEGPLHQGRAAVVRAVGRLAEVPPGPRPGAL